MNRTFPASFQRWLVVDDDDVMGGVISLIVRGLGPSSIDRYESAADALASVLDGKTYDVVVTDRDMTGVDGVDFARRIHAEMPHARIVMVTAHVDDLSVAELHRAGVYALLPKPFSTSLFEATARAMACEPVGRLSSGTHAAVEHRAA